MDITNFETKEVKLHDEIVDYLNDKERKQNFSFMLTEDGCNAVLALMDKYDKMVTETEELRERATPMKIKKPLPNMYECPWCGETENINPMIDYCPWCSQKLES